MIASLLILLAVNPVAAQECPDVDDLRIQESYGGLDNWQAYDATKNLISMGSVRHFRVTSSNVGDEGANNDDSEAVPAEGCDCEWSIDPTSWSSEIKGGLDKYPEIKDPRQKSLYPTVTYVAPIDLLDCLDEQVLIKATCDRQEVRTIDVIVTPQDPDADNEGEEAPQYDTPCSVSGGGCTSPQSNGSTERAAVWLLFPLLGLGGWARRRD